MRGKVVGACALAVTTLAFNVDASPIAFDFHVISDFGGPNNATPPPLPPAILSASEWDVVGSILFDNELGTEENQWVVGGSLSINGVSLGNFTSANYSEGYNDEPEEEGAPPDYANFGIHFYSEAYGESFFSLYSEDYGGGISYGDAQSFLAAYPVGGYQTSEVMVGQFPNAFEVFTDNLEGFTIREVEEPGTPVPEPSPLALIALGMAGIFWLRRRGVA